MSKDGTKHTPGPWRAVYNEHTKEITIYGYDGDDPHDVSEKQLEDGAVHCRIVAILPYFNDYGYDNDLDLIVRAPEMQARIDELTRKLKCETTLGLDAGIGRK